MVGPNCDVYRGAEKKIALPLFGKVAPMKFLARLCSNTVLMQINLKHVLEFPIVA